LQAAGSNGVLLGAAATFDYHSFCQDILRRLQRLGFRPHRSLCGYLGAYLRPSSKALFERLVTQHPEVVALPDDCARHPEYYLMDTCFRRTDVLAAYYVLAVDHGNLPQILARLNRRRFKPDIDLRVYRYAALSRNAQGLYERAAAERGEPDKRYRSLSDIWQDDRQTDYAIVVDPRGVAAYWGTVIAPAQEGVINFPAIGSWMDQHRCYPNIWQLDVHGKATIYDSHGHTVDEQLPQSSTFDSAGRVPPSCEECQ